MVVRYGAVEDTEEEVNDNISEDSATSWYSHKSILLGVVLSLISGALFTTNNFIINQFGVVVSDAVLVRCVIQIIIFTFLILYSGDTILPEYTKKKLFTVSQGVIGAISFITSLASVSFMPVPDALCIIFACPVVTIVLSAVMLGDKLNCVKCFSGTVLLLGVILVCQPPFIFPNHPSGEGPASFLMSSHDGLYYVGVALAGTACLTGGLMDVLIAKCEGVSTPVLVNWSAVSGLLITVSSSQALPGGRILSYDIFKITLADWIILIGLAASGLMAFTCMTLALKLISPNLVSSLRTLELVLAYGVQALVTGENPDVLSSIGGGLILCGVLVLTFQDKIFEMFSVIHISPYVGFYQTIPAQRGYQRIGD